MPTVQGRGAGRAKSWGRGVEMEGICTQIADFTGVTWGKGQAGIGLGGGRRRDFPYV
jgi:hypothetical protein